MMSVELGQVVRLGKVGEWIENRDGGVHQSQACFLEESLKDDNVVQSTREVSQFHWQWNKIEFNSMAIRSLRCRIFNSILQRVTSYVRQDREEGNISLDLSPLIIVSL